MCVYIFDRERERRERESVFVSTAIEHTTTTSYLFRLPIVIWCFVVVIGDLRACINEKNESAPLALCPFIDRCLFSLLGGFVQNFSKCDMTHVCLNKELGLLFSLKLKHLTGIDIHCLHI